MSFETRQAALQALSDTELIAEYIRRCRQFREAYGFEKDGRRRGYQEAWLEINNRGLQLQAEQERAASNAAK